MPGGLVASAGEIESALPTNHQCPLNGPDGDILYGVATTYSYDGDGHRVTKTSGGNTTLYIYSGAGELAAEYSTQAQTPLCKTCFLGVDHLGSTRMVMDESGAVKARHDYFPWGEELLTASRTGALGYQANDGVSQKFTSKERDAETGLDYFGARYMSAAQGRFTSPDEPFNDQGAGDPQSWNLFSYGRNNPLRYTDPTGTTTCDENGDNCHDEVTVTAKAPKTNTTSSPIGPLIINVLVTTSQVAQKTQELIQPLADWLSRPRNPLCTASYTGAGASIGFWAGGGVGSLGLAGGPAAATVPGGAAGGAALGGAIGGLGGLVLCSTGSGSGGGGGGQSYGGHKSSSKWANQMAKRGWTEQQIDEAIANGKQFSAPNNVNPAIGPPVLFIQQRAGPWLLTTSPRSCCMLAAMDSNTKRMTKTIHVRLLNEGTEVSRPTEGREIGEGLYEILPTFDYDPADEDWEFPPGSHVRIAKQESDDGEYFIAVRG